MDNKLAEKIEHLEAQLPRWEKWLYACYSAALVMLAQGFIKPYESQMIYNILFSISEKIGTTNPRDLDQYFTGAYSALFSPWLGLLWFIVELIIFVSVATLAFHSAWRKIALIKRLDLIFGYLLAGWINLLSIGAQDQLNNGTGYVVLVIIYLLALGFGYWWLRRKKDKAEEVFP